MIMSREKKRNCFIRTEEEGVMVCEEVGMHHKGIPTDTIAQISVSCLFKFLDFRLRFLLDHFIILNEFTTENVDKHLNESICLLLVTTCLINE